MIFEVFVLGDSTRALAEDSAEIKAKSSHTTDSSAVINKRKKVKTPGNLDLIWS